MKIVAYDVQNFKGLKEVSFTPDPWVVYVVGRNGAGKTSVLDSIWATLGGKDASPAQPVRKGAKTAVCTLNLGDLAVRRTWATDGTSRLIVENADGSRPKTPQALLDSLASHVAFDPLAFVRESPKEQAKTLRRLAGLEEKFQAIDQEITELFADRTQVNKAIAAAKQQLATFPTPIELVNVPDEAPSITDLTTAYQNAYTAKHENETYRRNALCAQIAADNAQATYESANNEVKRLRDLLKRAEQSVDASRLARDQALQAFEAATAKVAALVDPDVNAAKAAVDEAGAIIRRVEIKKARASWAARLKEEQNNADKLSSAILERNLHKAALMAAAVFPVPGLNCDGDEVLVDGVPLQQVSTSQQYRLALGVGAALNPKLRIAMIRDGSLLDDQSLADFVAWAKEQDFQLWIERVANDSTVDGLVIEAGQIKEPGSNG